MNTEIDTGEGLSVEQEERGTSAVTSPVMDHVPRGPHLTLRAPLSTRHLSGRRY